MNILIHHGWMHDAADMYPLADALRAAGHFVVTIDRGYFANNFLPDELPNDGAWFAVGHSLGYIFALSHLRANGITPIGGIRISGFSRFPAAAARIEKLRAALLANPAGAYEQFRRLCGYRINTSSITIGNSHGGEKIISVSGAALLLQDLDILATNASPIGDEPETIPVLAVHGARDRVVPLEYALGETQTQAIPLQIDVHAAHALDANFSVFCARQILAYLEQRPVNRTIRQTTPIARDRTAEMPARMHSPVANAFSQAARTYNINAVVQKIAATQLIESFVDFQNTDAAPASISTIADLGAGTGILTQLMRSVFPRAEIDAYDFAPQMIESLNMHFCSDRQIRTHVTNAETVAFAAVDLAASNFCWQWFENFEQSLQHHAGQSRYMAIAVPIDGTFSNWRSLLRNVSAADRTLPLITAENLIAALRRIATARTEVHIYTIDVEFEDAWIFLRSLRAVGAQTPANAALQEDSDALAGLRRALRNAPAPFHETYRVARIMLESAKK